MQLHWFYFNTIAIVHCENNKNVINTQIIANGLALSLRLHLASISGFPLQHRRLLPTKKTFNRFGGAWKTWNATAVFSCAPPAPPTDRRRGAFRLCYLSHFSHLPPSLSASRGKQARQIFSPLFPLELPWWRAARPQCIFVSLFFWSLECQAWSCGKETVSKNHFHHITWQHVRLGKGGLAKSKSN